MTCWEISLFLKKKYFTRVWLGRIWEMEIYVRNTGKDWASLSHSLGDYACSPTSQKVQREWKWRALAHPPWQETLLLSQVSSQLIQETKEGPEMKVQTHCHPVTAGGSHQTTPKCCVAPYWARSLLKWANRLWCDSVGSALPPGAGDPLAAPFRGTGKAGEWMGARLGGWSSSCLDLALTIFCPMQRQTWGGEGGKSCISLRRGKSQAFT